jgi:hypothetical protein
VLSLGAPHHSKQARSPEGSFGATSCSFTSKVLVEHSVGSIEACVNSRRQHEARHRYVSEPTRQHAAQHHSAGVNPRKPHAARRAGSSWGFGFMTWDLPAGLWAFSGVPRSALLCPFPRVEPPCSTGAGASSAFRASVFTKHPITQLELSMNPNIPIQNTDGSSWPSALSSSVPAAAQVVK